MGDCGALMDDYVGADNPVRVVETFVDELDLAALGFCGRRAGSNRSALVSSRHAAQDLSLRLPEPHRVEPTARARSAAQVIRLPLIRLSCKAT